MSSFDMTYMKILSFGRCIRGCLLVDFVLSLTNLLLKTEDKRLTGILQRMTMTHYWSTEPVWISIGHSPAREMQGRIEYFDKKSAMSNTTPTPQIYIAKYNRFVDGILGSINKILRRSYDPVNVRLQSADNAKKSSGKKSGHKRRKNSHRRRKTQKSRRTSDVVQNKMIEEDNMTIVDSRMPERLPPSTDKLITKHTLEANNANENRGTDTSNKTGNKRKSETSAGNKNKKKNGNKNSPKQQPIARGTLYGLSSLKRSGDVKINMMGDYTTVKTNFILGPLILRVEKEFGRGSKRELKSATATTAEMLGRISLRVVKGGAATLHSIKVQQPRAVSVESADNHDRTREFVWKRSSHIASVVSQQLTNAAKSMLQPPPATQTTTSRKR